MDKIEQERIFTELIDTIEHEGMKVDLIKLKQIFDYSINVYQDSKRYKGESTFSHAVHVAEIVATFKIGVEAVYASVLHEVPKFEEYKYEDIKNKFGEEIAELVQDSSRLYLLNYDGQQELEAEKLRKMFMAIAKDIRVVIMKLADRLYNMRNIYEETQEIQIKKANETMHVYAPIASRLGMSEVKSELEDIAFSILNPEEYERIRKIIELERSERQRYINIRIEEIRKYLEEQNIQATIYGRAKYYYSIYKKTKRDNCRVQDLFDLYAIRVIVDSISQCYNVLGIIHQHYKPIPGRFKDYIAVPKTNMYQSLHTTLFGEGQAPFEVQIRTWNMHKVAEYGVAAHFLYKEGKKKLSQSDEMLTWLRKTIELEQEIDGNYNDIKIELFGDEVFVFTPKGEIKSLPKGSTVIDFAYGIHQKIGDTMVGAKINGKMVPITTKLKNTDVVEIVTSKTSTGPKLDWIKNIKTTSAKNKIVSFLKKQDKSVNIVRGQELLEKEIIKLGLEPINVLKTEYIAEMLEKFNCNNIEECYGNIGFGVISPKKPANKLYEIYQEKTNKLSNTDLVSDNSTSKHVQNMDGVIVKGIDNCLVKFAKCCNPIPGDEIIGYISVGKGVSIHRSDCPNLTNLDISERKIEVGWKLKTNIAYATKIIVLANNRTGVAMELLKLMQDSKIKILGFTAKSIEDNQCEIDIDCEVESVNDLQRVIKEIKKVDSVYEVRRKNSK